MPIYRAEIETNGQVEAVMISARNSEEALDILDDIIDERES